MRIHQYRNVVPGTYLEFNQGFNVLLGRNGTGKSTLLELIEMLWVHGFERIRGEAFHIECEAEFAPSAKGVVERLEFRCPDFRFGLLDDRGEISVDRLSYGEKRLLAFLWYLNCSEDTVIADELVDGFHHAWIERCIELIGERQCFLASQNPLLLDYLPIEDMDYARRCFITCRRGPESQGQMAWSNIGPDDAAEFYRAYARETQYVSEILRGRGLW